MSATIDDWETALLVDLWANSPHKVILTDAQGRIVVANPEAERFLGYPSRSLAGLPIAGLVRDVTGRRLLKSGAPPELAVGRLIQVVHKAGHAALVRVGHVVDMSSGGKPFRMIIVDAVGEWGEDALRLQGELEAVTAISSSVCQAQELSSILESALEKVGDLLEMEMGAVALIGDESGDARIVARRGITCAAQCAAPERGHAARDDAQRRGPVRSDDALIAIPTTTGRPLLIADLSASNVQTRAAVLGCRSFAAAPIVVRNNALGAIILASRQPKQFPQGTDDLLRIIGLQAGIAVDNARLLQREALRARQLEAAVQELHHRVKNNMEVLSAVLELARDREGAADIVDRLLERIGAMAAVHGLMREGRWGEETDAAELVNQVVTLIGDSCGSSDRHITLAVNADRCTLPAHLAAPLALITCELVSNAMRHAFAEMGGAVEVCLRCAEAAAELVVADNGKGMTDPFAASSPRSMGLQIVRALVEHNLAGQLEIQSAKGTRVRVAFSVGNRRGSSSEPRMPAELPPGRPLAPS